MFPGNVNTRFLVLVCSIAASCQFATGFELGRTNSYYFEYSNLYTTLYIITLLLGLSIGSFSVKYLNNHFGRRALMIISAGVLLVGTALVASMQNVVDGIYTTIAARFIDGCACGIGSTVAPIYSNDYTVNEIATSELSGKFGALNQVFMTLGICTASITQLLHFEDLMLNWWQVAYLIFIGLVLLHISMLVFVAPDSPHSCIERGDIPCAKATLRKIIKNPGASIDEFQQTRIFVRIDPESSQGIKIALRKS